MTDEERARLVAAFASLRFEARGDDDDDEWFLTGETTDGQPLKPFATFDNLEGRPLDLDTFRREVDRIKSESGSPLGGATAAHPSVAERLREASVTIEVLEGAPPIRGGEDEIAFAYTCGAVQAGSMVVLCDCGCVRQHDRPHDYVADIQLRGWICYCGIFNGEEKDRQTTCRTCGVVRPM